MKPFALFLALALAAFGQSSQGDRFSATTGDLSLSAAGTTFTLQQPSTGSHTVSLESATVYCSVACNVTQTVNGTAATSTAGTVVPLMAGAPTATVWTASNVGAGTGIGGIVHVPAGATVVLDLSKLGLRGGAGTGNNYSVVVASITGTANITLVWSEMR